MKFQVLILLAVLASVALSNPAQQKKARRQFIEQQKQKQRERIFGGVESPRNSIPFIVSLLLSYETFATGCGGSLIRSGTVLTAAHCLVSDEEAFEEVLVIAGAHNIDIIESTQQRRRAGPDEIFIHEDYVNSGHYPNDIALIFTDDFTINRYVEVGFIPDYFVTEDFAGEIGTSAGWGSRGAEGGPTNYLRQVTQTITTNAYCDQRWAGPILSSNICMFTSGRDVCSGDSGGPLFVDYFDDVDPRLIVGLVSWGGDCVPTETRPGVYTRISSYVDWIGLSIEAREKKKNE